MNKLLAFTASWCGPCKVLKPILAKLPEGTVTNYDVDEKREMAELFGVKAVPTVIILNEDGEEKKRFLGNISYSALAEYV